METVGVEPTPLVASEALCHQSFIPRRCGRVESNHHSAGHCVYSAESSPMLSVRNRRRFWLDQTVIERRLRRRCRLCRRRPPLARHRSRTPENHHGPRSGPDFPAEGRSAGLEPEPRGSRPRMLPLHHDHHVSGDDRTRTGACSPDKRVLLAAELRPLDSAGGIRTHGLELMRLAGTATPLRRASARLESNQRSPAPKAGGVADLPYRQMIRR
jgi:hypothetical protein